MSFFCDGYPRDLVIADCGGDNPEIECNGACCTCCEDGDEKLECQDHDWLGNLDPIWEHGFGRLTFDFDIAVWAQDGF